MTTNTMKNKSKMITIEAAKLTGIMDELKSLKVANESLRIVKDAEWTN